MNDDLKRYPYVQPEELREFEAFRWGLATGIVIGLALTVFVTSAWVAS